MLPRRRWRWRCSAWREDRAGAALTAFELIGETAFGFSQKHTPGAVPPLSGDWPWHVLMEISSGRSAEDARALAEDILTAGIEAGFVGDATIAASLGQADDFWKLQGIAVGFAAPRGRLDQARHLRAGGGDPGIHQARRRRRRVGLAAGAHRLLRPHGRRQSALQHFAAERRRRRRPSWRSTSR